VGCSRAAEQQGRSATMAWGRTRLGQYGAATTGTLIALSIIGSSLHAYPLDNFLICKIVPNHSVTLGVCLCSFPSLVPKGTWWHPWVVKVVLLDWRCGHLPKYTLQSPPLSFSCVVILFGPASDKAASASAPRPPALACQLNSSQTESVNHKTGAR